METKDFLKQYLCAKREVDALQATIQHAERIGKQIPQSIQEKYSTAVQAQEKAHDTVFWAIQCVSDLFNRQLLEYRFLSGMKFREIVRCMQYSKTQIFRRYRAALTQVEQALEGAEHDEYDE